MPAPGEHKTVQAPILKYAQDVGWTVLSREKAEERRAGFRLAAAQLYDSRPIPNKLKDVGDRNVPPPLSLFPPPSLMNR